MSETTATIVDRFYAAWNGHDASAVAGSFMAGGLYSDPLTGDGLLGDELRDHVQSVLDVLRDLRIAVTRTVTNENAAAVVWAAEGTWDGVLGLLRASETPVRFEGTDVFELDDGRLRLVRRSFDQLSLADALRLQTIVEPYGDGDLTVGHSMREWVSKARPGALGMTWLLARDETEKLAIRARASRLSVQATAGQILIGQRLFAAVEKNVETVPTGNLELKGFARPVAAYEVRGLR
jgi:hypothetical protein